MSKLKLKPNQLVSIKRNAGILRSFPTFSMELSEKFNDLILAVTPAGKEMDLLGETFNEKTSAVNKMPDGEAKKKAITQLEADIKKVNAKEYEVEITPIKKAEFKDLEIKGEKHVDQGNGLVQKFDYRDAYFELINEGMIV